MPNFLKKTIQMLFIYDIYGCGIKKKAAKRRFDRVANTMEKQSADYFFSSAFDSVGKHLSHAIRRGLNG